MEVAERLEIRASQMRKRLIIACPQCASRAARLLGARSAPAQAKLEWGGTAKYQARAKYDACGGAAKRIGCRGSRGGKLSATEWGGGRGELKSWLQRFLQ
jgi:hypothetical protein